MLVNPPHSNGIMQLTEEERLSIKEKLQVIQSEFVPTNNEEVLSIHGLVSIYNIENIDNEINGDTAQSILDTHL